MSKNSSGKGYGTEALQLIIRYVFDTLNLDRIIDFITSSNKAAIRSNLKAGMVVEGELKE